MKWISVKDELPKYGVKVLANYIPTVYPDKQNIVVATLDLITRHCGENSPKDDRWFCFPKRSGEITAKVTHWMPLPKPPKN